MTEHNLANSISSSQNGLNNLFSSTNFYCKKKFIEGIVMRREKDVFFFKFRTLYSKYKFLRLWYFFLTYSYLLPNQLNILVEVHIYKIHVFDEVFFVLNVRMLIATKLFRVLICWELLSPINMHDTSMGWYCEVTCRIKYISLPTEEVWTPNYVWCSRSVRGS